MRQFQFEYNNHEQFRKELTKVKQWKSSHITSNVVLQVYSVELEDSIFKEMFKIIDEILPSALYLGCSTNGNILDGKISSSDIIIVCTIFEYPSTKVKLLQYDLNDTNSVEIVDKLIEEVNNNSWVKAIEFLVTMRGRSMTDFCDRMCDVREGVEIFGGGAFAPDINSHKVCIYSNDKGYSVVRKFQPEVIHIFSCAARKTFWGDEEVSKETFPFQSIAPTSGFFTSGEFLRTGKCLNQHNVTLVIASMREGERLHQQEDFIMQKENFSGKVSMINRLATFIQAATEELEEANRKLALSVVTDGMTKLLNRTEINRIIKEACKYENLKPDSLCLVMLDIDNFKKVNDTYGHKEGDNVIVALSDILRDVSEKYQDVHAGRWGGEEFMLLFKNYSVKQAYDVAESIRVRFSNTKFKKCENKTISIGVTSIKEHENSDNACIRVDNALYQAKNTGKNRIVVL